MHNMETLSANKRKKLLKVKKVIKKVKKAVNTRWLNLNASVDRAYTENIGLLEKFSIFETEVCNSLSECYTCQE